MKDDKDKWIEFEDILLKEKVDLAAKESSKLADEERILENDSKIKKCKYRESLSPEVPSDKFYCTHPDRAKEIDDTSKMCVNERCPIVDFQIKI